jgi:phosphofructokinase-like protein
MHTVGILTGGGDAPGLNAVIRAVVKSAEQVHGWHVLGLKDGFNGLLNDVPPIPLSGEVVRGLLPRGGTILGADNRGNPFAHKLKRDGEVVEEDRSDYAVQRIQDLGLEGLILIGGDGTMHIGYGLMQKGVKIVGVPKTIDNDLAGTDVTFGFDTALGVATDALDRLHTTAEAHHRVMLLEVMGRNAGWLALHAALAGGTDAVLIPEIPYDIRRVVAKIRERNAAGYRFTIIVVAEGAQAIGGGQVFRHQADDPLLQRLGGVSYRVSEEINGLLPNIEVRTTVLGHVQRGGTPSPVDRILATRYGVAAMDLVATGQWGRMVALRGQDLIDIPIEEAIATAKLVNPNGPLVRAARRLGMEFGG